MKERQILGVPYLKTETKFLYSKNILIMEDNIFSKMGSFCAVYFGYTCRSRLQWKKIVGLKHQFLEGERNSINIFRVIAIN